MLCQIMFVLNITVIDSLNKIRNLYKSHFTWCKDLQSILLKIKWNIFLNSPKMMNVFFYYLNTFI
jgi:hypothetical protein